MLKFVENDAIKPHAVGASMHIPLHFWVANAVLNCTENVFSLCFSFKTAGTTNNNNLIIITVEIIEQKLSIGSVEWRELAGE